MPARSDDARLRLARVVQGARIERRQHVDQRPGGSDVALREPLLGHSGGRRVIGLHHQSLCSPADRDGIHTEPFAQVDLSWFKTGERARSAVVERLVTHVHAW